MKDRQQVTVADTIEAIVEAVTNDGTILEGCPHCGALLPEMKGQADMIVDLERALRAERTKNTKLRGKQNGAVKNNPFYPDAVIVWQHWRELIAPRAKEFSGKRLKAVMDRLQGGFTPDELCQAVEGYHAFPFVTQGKRTRTGTEDDRFQDLELICRDPVNVGKGLELYKRTVVYDTGVALQGANAEMSYLCDCGHPRVHHLPGRLNQFGLSPCCEGDCDCVDFDDSFRRAEAWRVKNGLAIEAEIPGRGRDLRLDSKRQSDAQMAIDWKESA